MSLKLFREEENAGHPLSEVKHVLAIAAGKGGVGKSSLTVNLALALESKGYSVGVMDTDIYGPSVRRMLPEDLMPKQRGELIYPALCRGIRMISMAYFRSDKEAAVVRAPIANGIVTQFLRQVRWGPLDFLLIDFPPGTGDIQLTLSQQASLSGAVMVTTPQEVALMDVRKAMNMFQQVQVPILGVVENMSYFYHEPSGERIAVFGEGGGERLAEEAGVPLLGQVPIDSELCRCGDEGLSLFAQAPEGATAKALLAVADTVTHQAEALRKGSAEELRGFELLWKDD